MNTVGYVRDVVIPAAYLLLPKPMNSDEATALLLSIGLQESRFQHRRQINGPARGWWQFERDGGIAGVLKHAATHKAIEAALDTLGYPADHHECYAAVEHNDVLACVFARLLLYSDPKPLPKVGDEDASWHYYLRTWRPGKPHRLSWDDNVERAWALV